ncbi:energy-coupling factor ABC transporter permease [Telmatocola sphagniphila]|uniref:Energy-coupling factor ABC transporter permease n=1 Tax=Telmatocola sphagniphila TaxID=1123043 RepID=A0A8E6B522_9BACT|nr:energy-coupling factor ABC transporter permease [Telmatocola sphagniphila]QVL30530.1 energy-coupling factor ABC transporter permease [Telmatocola sphagniphila]
MPLPLLAAHISDGVLQPIPQIVGIAVAVALLAFALRKLRDDQIPRVILCTAVFFIASLIHIRIGPTSAHLLLNGLIGILLGYLAIIPIAVGLFMQAVLFGHGGFLVWGMNCCIFTLPALIAPYLFSRLQNADDYGGPVSLPFTLALGALLQPILTLPIWLVTQMARLQLSRKSFFPAAFLCGFTTVMLTVFLNGFVLVAFGNADWRWIAAIVVAGHLPLAFVEGIIAGFACEAMLKNKRP